MEDEDNDSDSKVSKSRILGSALTMQRILSYTGRKSKDSKEETGYSDEDLGTVNNRQVSSTSSAYVYDSEAMTGNGRQLTSDNLGQTRGLRGFLARVLDNHNFDLVMGLIIVCNIGVMIVETDKMAICAPGDSRALEGAVCEDPVILLLDRVFLFTYTFEAAMRIYVLRWRTFHSLWNDLDIFIVSLGYVDLIMSNVDTDGMPGPSISLLRIFRVFRLLRAIRVFQKIPELYAMLRGFISAMQSMFWGFIMVLVLLLLFSVLSVELIHPKSLLVHADEPYCREAFSNVWHCMIMFFQTLVAGDSWGKCFIPIIKEDGWTFVIFAAALIAVQLGFMNLILAVIVERATRAQEEDEEEARRIKMKQARKATIRLTNLFKTIDEDNSGTISLDELMNGFDSNSEMQNIFGKLDMTRSDVQLLFELMDTDDEGDLGYGYLIDNLRNCQLDNTKKSLTMLRLQIAEIGRCCKKLHTDKRLDRIGSITPRSHRESNGSRNYAEESGEVSATISEAGKHLAMHSRQPRMGREMRQTSTGSGVPLCLATFEQELKEFRQCIEAEFTDLRTSMRGLNESVLSGFGRANDPRSMLPREHTNEVTFAPTLTSTSQTPERIIELCEWKESPQPPWVEDGLEDTAVNGSASTLHQAKDQSDLHGARQPPSSRQLRPARLAAMFQDNALRVEKGPGPGECSL